jgi:hypothetical protein
MHKQASKEEQRVETVRRYANLNDTADNKYYHDILRKDKAWEEMSAIMKCPGKDQVIIIINDEFAIVFHRVMKRHWVSGTERF